MRMYMIPNNFVKIGEYIELNKAPDYEPFIGRSKSKICLLCICWYVKVK